MCYYDYLTSCARLTEIPYKIKLYRLSMFLCVFICAYMSLLVCLYEDNERSSLGCIFYMLYF